MAEEPHPEQIQAGESGIYPQRQPGQFARDSALTDLRATTPHLGEWQPTATTVVLSQAGQQMPRDQLSNITNPLDVYLTGDQNPPNISTPAQPAFLEDIELQSQLRDIMPGRSQQDALPGLLFGTGFHWGFNPASEHADGIWAQMSAQSWLDTSDGWDTMLRPDSPNPTEGDLSVDSRAIHFVPRTPSVLSLNDDEYVEENGRKYHKFHAGKYLLPNDEMEQDRLDLQHAAYTMLFHGKLNLAPIGDPKRALDLATGTGIWAIQFAEKHPDTTVIGTDLSPIQPDAKPKNCRFWVEDCEDPWHFDLPFDYIHARLVCSCFNDARAVIAQAYDNLEPGGWIEFQDADSVLHCDDTSMDGSAISRLFELFNEGAARLGRNVRVTEYYKQWMMDVGFEDVVERKFKVPGNTWPKDPYAKQIGQYVAADIKDAVDGVSKAALTRGLGISEDERQALAQQAKFDCCNPAVHWYVKVYVVYGRKPFVPPVTTDATTLAGIGTSF